MPYKITTTEPEAIVDDAPSLTQITRKQQEANRLRIPKPKKKQATKRKRKIVMKNNQMKQGKHQD